MSNIEINEVKRKIQEEALDALEKNNYNGIVLLPTGVGKTWVLIEALKSDYLFNEIYLETNIKPEGKINEIISMAKHRGIKIESIDKKRLNNLTKSQEHQGVAASIDFELKKLEIFISMHYL